jgi:hypothetical protein
VAKNRFDVTSDSPIILSFSARDRSDTPVSLTFPIKASIYDEVDDRLIASGVTFSTEKSTLPEIYRQDIGVYRYSFQDASGRINESTIAITTGTLHHADIEPISTQIVK